MTLHRTAGSIDAKILEALRDLTDTEILSFTGKTRAHFHKISHPENDWGLHLTDAALLDAALIAKGQPPVFRPVYDEMVRMATRGTDYSMDLSKEVRRVSVEVGELNGVVDEALEDNHLSAREKRDIAKEAQGVIDRATAIRDAMEPSENVSVMDIAEKVG